MNKRGRTALRIGAVVAAVFGLMTIIEGGAVLLNVGTARASHAHVVPFVLWFNFLSGFVYVAAAAGLWLLRRWGAWLSVALPAAIGATFLAFAVHIALAQPYDRQTIAAMTMRLAVWTALGALAGRILLRRHAAIQT